MGDKKHHEMGISCACIKHGCFLSSFTYIAWIFLHIFLAWKKVFEYCIPNLSGS